MKEELISKLKQLDRIEYRQKVKELEDSLYPSLRGYVWKVLAFISFLFLMDIWLFMHNGYWMNPSIYSRIMQVFVIGGTILFFCDLVSILIYLIQKRKLNKEYFKVKIEVKK